MQTPQTPPTPTAAPVVAGTPPPPGISSPSAIFRAFQNQREELDNQVDRLQDQRDEVSRQLREPGLNSVDKGALEQRLVATDQRIAVTEKLLAEADARVANAAAIPGAVVPPPPERRNGPPDEVFVLAGIFMFVVLLPLSIAWARRIWRRSATVVTKLPQDIYDRFARVDQSLDAIAVEVERIGEGQRFLTKLQAERALGAGPAERVEIAERERDRQGRR